MTSASFALLPERGILAIAGPDRRSFLQGLVSNDVEKVGPERAVYAAFLTPQGKYLHDFIMVEQDDAILLDTEAGRLADLKKRLSIYRLRAKVELAERRNLIVAAILGDGALQAAGLPEIAGTARGTGGGIVMVDPRLSALGARAILPHDTSPAVLASMGLAEADFAVWDRHRLALGVPDGSRDLMPDKSILLESGFDELNGVDWQKGCYIGQELTARTKYRGLIKKRLFPVQMTGGTPPAGSEINANGKDAGELRSSRDGIGLALLRLDAVAEHAPLTAEETSLTPLRPNWMRLQAEESAAE